jgi:hypothetical protein
MEASNKKIPQPLKVLSEMHETHGLLAFSWLKPRLA